MTDPRALPTQSGSPGERPGESIWVDSSGLRHLVRQGPPWTIYVCPICKRSWHKSTGKPRNFCVGDGRIRHEGCAMEPVVVVPEAERDQLVKAGLACLGFGNDGSVPDLLTLIERMGLRP